MPDELIKSYKRVLDPIDRVTEILFGLIEFYSESEYVFVPADRSENFGYTWSQLTLAPVDWFQFGLATQRTRAYQTDLDVQRGLLLGFSWKRVDLGAYLFNPDRDQPIWIFSVTVNF